MSFEASSHYFENPTKKIKSTRSPSPSIPGIDSTYSQIKTQVPQYAPPVQDLSSQERLERLGKSANGADVPTTTGRLNEYQPPYASANDRDKDNRSHDSQRRPEERRQRDVDNRSLDVSKTSDRIAVLINYCNLDPLQCI